MELGGGSESATKNQTLSSADAAGEDRLSALPDDVLVLILLKLTTGAAAQTSVLSHRWRRVWALLPEFWLYSPPEPHRLRDVLDGHNVLRDVLDGHTAESLGVWLPAAARRVSGRLLCIDIEDEAEAEAAQRGALEFPCFEKATEISFILGYQGLAMPVTGVFARLTQLNLRHVWFHGPGELGDAVSSPRCPCLQRLAVEDVRGLRNLTIHSASMLWMKLWNLRTLSQLTVVAPGLKDLILESCLVKNDSIANISAPLLTSLNWIDDHDPSSVHLGKMGHLQRLRVQRYFVYGQIFYSMDSCLSLLQRFKVIKGLFLPLVYPRDIENYDYMMEEMAVLPDITSLCLILIANGHAFGASAFHVLRLCTGIRRFCLQLVATRSEAQTLCTSDCKCLQRIEWETEELMLNHLEEVEITGWRGTEHEVTFVKRLFDRGIKIKEMKVKFCLSISDDKAKELYRSFHSFSRPGVCVRFYHQVLLYAPED